MRWIFETSAWSRRKLPEVKAQLEELLGEDDELVLSPSNKLEILREPQWEAVAELRDELEAAMDTLDADPETFILATDAMVAMAMSNAESHRRPVPDLITAALAHQHACGIIHLDGDFEDIVEQSELEFATHRIELDDNDDGDGEPAHPAQRQRQLKVELAQLVHQMSMDEAEEYMAEVVERARERVGPADA